MKILYWVPHFLPDIGGIQILAAQTLPYFQERSYEFVILACHGNHDVPDETEYNGIPIYRFPFRTALAKGNPGQMVKIRQQIAKLKQSFQPDLVHIHFAGPEVFFHLATATAHPAPTLLTFHTSVANYRGGSDTILGKILRMADWVTAVSGATLSDAQQVVPKIKKRSSVIYNGLEMPDLIPEPLPFEAPRILCLGRLVDDKGFDLAITTFASLINRFSQARLIIAGDGPERPNLERQAAALGLGDVVEFTGFIDPQKVPELLNTATVCVMPSRWSEPLGLVALEAAQMARPVVGTRVGGLSEAVVHQQTGLLVEKEDSLALVEAIAFLLNNPDQARKMGQAAHSRVVNDFSLENFVNSYDALYQKLVQEAHYVMNNEL